MGHFSFFIRDIYFFSSIGPKYDNDCSLDLHLFYTNYSEIKKKRISGLFSAKFEGWPRLKIGLFEFLEASDHTIACF